jgi:hypothetical protein
MKGDYPIEFAGIQELVPPSLCLEPGQKAGLIACSREHASLYTVRSSLLFHENAPS